MGGESIHGESFEDEQKNYDDDGKPFRWQMLTKHKCFNSFIVQNHFHIRKRNCPRWLAWKIAEIYTTEGELSPRLNVMSLANWWRSFLLYGWDALLDRDDDKPVGKMWLELIKWGLIMKIGDKLGRKPSQEFQPMQCLVELESMGWHWLSEIQVWQCKQYSCDNLRLGRSLSKSSMLMNILES